MISKDFVLAGKAIFTLEIPETFRIDHECNAHYTFRINHKEASANYPEAYFVQLLSGPDNSNDYVYLGMLKPETGEFRLTGKSSFSENSWPVRFIRRIVSCLWQGREQEMTAFGFELHHEGRCGRCGRRLTVPESIKTGLGPECAGRLS